MDLRLGRWCWDYLRSALYRLQQVRLQNRLLGGRNCSLSATSPQCSHFSMPGGRSSSEIRGEEEGVEAGKRKGGGKRWRKGKKREGGREGWREKRKEEGEWGGRRKGGRESRGNTATPTSQGIPCTQSAMWIWFATFKFHVYNIYRKQVLLSVKQSMF